MEIYAKAWKLYTGEFLPDMMGEVTWAEANKKKSFRSALELIRLIDGALEVDE